MKSVTAEAIRCSNSRLDTSLRWIELFVELASQKRNDPSDTYVITLKAKKVSGVDVTFILTDDISW